MYFTSPPVDAWAEEQATARVYRIGQERPVFVESLFTLGTIEERIVQLLEEKRRLFAEVFDEIGEDEHLLERVWLISLVCSDSLLPRAEWVLTRLRSR